MESIHFSLFGFEELSVKVAYQNLDNMSIKIMLKEGLSVLFISYLSM